MSQKKVTDLVKLLSSSDKKKVKKGLKHLSSYASKDLAPFFENSGLSKLHFVIDAAGKLNRGEGAYSERHEVQVSQRFAKATHGEAVTLHWLAMNNQLNEVKHLKLSIKDASLLPWTELKKPQTLEGLSIEGELPNFKYLEPLVSLKHLNLMNCWSEGSFADLPKQLESLILADRELDNLTELAHLTQLKSLKLWGMAMDSLSGLSQLESLEELELDAEGLNDISELSRAKTLKSLQLPIGCMSDPEDIRPVLDALSELTQLEQLSIEDLSGEITCSKEILACISKHTQLSSLSIPLDRNPDNLSDLPALTQLSHLGLEYELCRQVDMRFDSNALRQIPNLKSLSLGSNIVDQDLHNMNHLSSVKSLTLKQSSGVKQLGELNLEQLESFSLLWWPETYEITDQEWGRLAQLKCFALEGHLSDPSALKHLSNLEELDLEDVAIENLDFLVGLSSLKRLRISTCPALSDISALKNLDLEQLILLDCAKLKRLKPHEVISHVPHKFTDWPKGLA